MKQAAQPNILFIITDQWRGDCLGASGHPIVKTPHLDNLARQGASFARAYCAVPSCVAARAGLMTGLHQKHHGFVGYDHFLPWNYDYTMPQTPAAQKKSIFSCFGTFVPRPLLHPVF